jgi:hypothetical protein
MTTSLKCPVCSSSKISIEGAYASFENHTRYKHMGKKGTFARKDLTIGVAAARYCLDCRYQMLFASPEDIDQLSKAMSE